MVQALVASSASTDNWQSRQAPSLQVCHKPGRLYHKRLEHSLQFERKSQLILNVHACYHANVPYVSDRQSVQYVLVASWGLSLLQPVQAFCHPGLTCSHDAEQLGHPYRKVYVVTTSVRYWCNCTSNAVLTRHLIDQRLCTVLVCSDCQVCVSLCV